MKPTSEHIGNSDLQGNRATNTLVKVDSATVVRYKKVSEKTFRAYAWVLSLEWEQNSDWIDNEYLLTAQEVEQAQELTQDERDLGIIKKTIYQNGEIWHCVQVEGSRKARSCDEVPKRKYQCPTFRVWDKHLRCFVDDPHFCISLDGSLRLGTQNCDPDRYEVEQCVAVDKHGKPTYIGDLIFCEFTWWGRLIQGIQQVTCDAHWHVTPFHDWFIASPRKLWIEVLGKKFEVIGNIHQHHNLMSKIQHEAKETL